MADPNRGHTGARWCAVAHTREPDPHVAGSQVASDALTGSDPKLLVAFCSPSYDLEALSAGIKSISGDIPLIGCSTAGEIASDGPGEASAVVFAIGGPGFSIATAVGHGASANLRETGAGAATCIHQVADKKYRALMLLTDGLAGDQQEIVRGAYGVAGATVPLVGGCAGDDLKMRETQQLFGDEVMTDSVVAAAIGSDSPMGIGVQHGWSRLGNPMLVTKSENNRVFVLDDRPALDVYLERLDAPTEVRADPALFTEFALTHPLGISRRSGEEVRFVGEANFEDRSLGCIAEVPQGGLAWFMEGDVQSVLDGGDEAAGEALEQLNGESPIGLMAFDCIARRGVLGEGVKEEVDRLSALAPKAPIAGFYTYGEIARVKGMSGFHNQTLVVLALS